MERIEILTRYRWLMMEADTIMRQADKVMSIGAPMSVGSAWPSRRKLEGVGSTNDRESANAQSFDGYIERLREKAGELLEICGRFEEVLSFLEEDQERVICRKYYALGMTDEAIAEQVHMDQSTVNRIRNRALDRLA